MALFYYYNPWKDGHKNAIIKRFLYEVFILLFTGLMGFLVGLSLEFFTAPLILGSAQQHKKNVPLFTKYLHFLFWVL